MIITLTGAAGKLGSVVCHALVAAGHEVRATDRIYRRGLPAPLELANLLQSQAAYELLEGADAVVHLANHPHFTGDAQTVFNENVSVNMNVFQAAHDMGVQKIIFASSVQAFASRKDTTSCLPYLPIDGDLPPNPGNPYGLSKQVSETMLEWFSRAREGQFVALRFPWLLAAESLERIRQRGLSVTRGLSEGFTFLAMEDAAGLVNAILAATLPGFRIYFPAARGNLLGEPASDLIRKHYPAVPLKRPISELDCLVDISRIERETGWSPQQNDFTTKQST